MWICKKCNYSNGNSVVACIKCQFAEEEALKNRISSIFSDVTVVDEEKSSMKKKLKYLGLIILIAIIGYNLKQEYDIKKRHNERMENFENADNSTLYFEDCSSISIDKAFIQNIADFHERHAGKNYKSDTSGGIFKHNGDLMIIGLKRSEKRKSLGFLEFYDHIHIYKYMPQNTYALRSISSPTLNGWYDSFGPYGDMFREINKKRAGCP